MGMIDLALGTATTVPGEIYPLFTNSIIVNYGNDYAVKFATGRN